MIKRKVPLYLLLLVLISLGLVDSSRAAEDFLEKGIVEYKSENYEEALEFLIKAREQQPKSSVAAFYLGLTYKQVGDYGEATKQFKDAISLTPPVVDAYPELIEVLYHRDELKEAKERIMEAEREGIRPGPIAFLKGLVLLKEKDNKGAIEAFKRAKEVDASLSQAVDLQVAMIYSRQKRFEEAKKSLRSVISVDPASDLASFAKEYEDELTKAVEGYKAWRVTAGMGYQYDDNVVLKPLTGIPGLLITGERDHSLVTTLRAEYNPLLSGPWILNVQYNHYANTYEDVKTHNIVSETLSVNPGYNFERGALTLPLAYSYIWLHERSYQAVALVKPTLNWLLLPDHIGQLCAGYTRREMHEHPPDKDEERDGNIYSISPAYIHPFLNGRGILNLRYEFSYDETEGKNWENVGNRFNLSLLVPLINRVNLTVSGDVLIQKYLRTHTVFDVERREKTYGGSAGILWEMLKGFNLNLQYSHTRVNSNIPIYAYRRNVYNIGLEYTF